MNIWFTTVVFISGLSEKYGFECNWAIRSCCCCCVCGGVYRKQNFSWICLKIDKSVCLRREWAPCSPTSCNDSVTHAWKKQKDRYILVFVFSNVWLEWTQSISNRFHDNNMMLQGWRGQHTTRGHHLTREGHFLLDSSHFD